RRQSRTAPRTLSDPRWGAKGSLPKSSTISDRAANLERPAMGSERLAAEVVDNLGLRREPRATRNQERAPTKGERGGRRVRSGNSHLRPSSRATPRGSRRAA